MISGLIGGFIIGLYTSINNLGTGITLLLALAWGIFCSASRLP